MTFDEIPIYVAMYRVENLIQERISDGEAVPPFGSDSWIVDPERRSEMLSMIQGFLRHDESLLGNYVRYRKSGDKKLRLIAQVAILRGTTCFFENRGLGDCSEEIELDRILPGSRGGEYTVENCQIACRKHNQERGDKSIEQYLSSHR